MLWRVLWCAGRCRRTVARGAARLPSPCDGDVARYRNRWRRSMLETTAPSTRAAVARRPLGRSVVRWITSTDHKTIGRLYLLASFGFFLFGGVLALLIRAELFTPGIQIVQSKEQYNQL